MDALAEHFQKAAPEQRLSFCQLIGFAGLPPGGVQQPQQQPAQAVIVPSADFEEAGAQVAGRGGEVAAASQAGEPRRSRSRTVLRRPAW